MTNLELRPSIHIQREASNITRERIGRLALLTHETGIREVRFSKQERMYATLLGARALAEYYDYRGMNIVEDADNLRRRVGEALRGTRLTELEVPSLPTDIHTLYTRHRKKLYVLIAGVSETIAGEMAIARSAIDPHYHWPEQHNGLRIADSYNLESIKEVSELLDWEQSSPLPDYVTYGQVTMPDVNIRTWEQDRWRMGKSLP